MTPTRSRTRPAKVPAYIDKALLPPSATRRMLTYLYWRQAPVHCRTLALVAGVSSRDVGAYLHAPLAAGAVKRVRLGWYVIGKMGVKKAAALLAAVRPCAGAGGGVR